MSSAVDGRRQLAEALADRHPQHAAAVLDRSRAAVGASWLSEQPSGRAVAVMAKLTTETAEQLLRRTNAESAARILAGLDPNRAAALLARLSEAERQARLADLDPVMAKELLSLMTYPPDSAGRLMDPRVVAFRPEDQVQDALRKLRTLQQRRIQDVFVVDSDRVLLGSIPLQTLVFSPQEALLGSLVEGPPLQVPATSSRESVLEILQEHRAASLPVVDFGNHLLGVLRQRELLTTTAESASANLAKMVGASQDERALSSPFFAVRKRLPWLSVNLLTAFLAAAVVGLFESTIARFTALAVLLPVVAGQSGNTGAQALAVTMRGLALREVRVRHWLRVAGKELTAGFLNGVAVSLITAIAVYVWSRSFGLALVICVSMVISMTMAGMAGAVIPMILTSLRQDPAQSSSIILTTVTDVVGFLSFLGIATLLSAML